MAVGVKAPKDIKEYGEKVIVGMTLKQLLCLSIAAGVSIVISLVFITRLKIPMEITSWLMILSSIPTVSFSWLKRNGLTSEMYIRQFLKYRFPPSIRKKRRVSMKEEKKVAEITNAETNKDTGGQET